MDQSQPVSGTPEFGLITAVGQLMASLRYTSIVHPSYQKSHI